MRFILSTKGKQWILNQSAQINEIINALYGNKSVRTKTFNNFIAKYSFRNKKMSQGVKFGK